MSSIPRSPPKIPVEDDLMFAGSYNCGWLDARQWLVDDTTLDLPQWNEENAPCGENQEEQKFPRLQKREDSQQKKVLTCANSLWN